jgi:hypothetical protein
MAADKVWLLRYPLHNSLMAGSPTDKRSDWPPATAAQGPGQLRSVKKGPATSQGQTDTWEATLFKFLTHPASLIHPFLLIPTCLPSSLLSFFPLDGVPISPPFLFLLCYFPSPFSCFFFSFCQESLRQDLSCLTHPLSPTNPSLPFSMFLSLPLTSCPASSHLSPPLSLLAIPSSCL